MGIYKFPTSRTANADLHGKRKKGGAAHLVMFTMDLVR